MHNHQSGMLRFLLVVIMVAFAGLLPVQAQEEDEAGEPVVRITQIETGDFPDLALNVVAIDAENNLITDFSDAVLLEDETAVSDFESSQVAVGVDLIFVIDANSSITQQDDTSGLSRLDKVRESINGFANQYMSTNQLDRVSIIVPDEEGGRFLDDAELTFPNEVINAINFYQPEQPTDTPLQVMLELALSESEERAEDGRFQAVILFTDGGQLDQQLDSETLVDSAQTGNVTFLGAILGSRADPNEIDNVTALTGPTGGAYVHMPEVADADPLYTFIQERSNQTQISYRSQINSSGLHTIDLELAGVTAQVLFDLTVEAPVAEIIVDNSMPIRRALAEADMPLEEAEPQSQPMAAQISWPDGYSRLLETARLIVNDEAVALTSLVLDDSGTLTFDWDISTLDEGSYELEIEVTDELGLQGTSEALLFDIEVSRPQVATPTVEAPTATPVPAATEESGGSIGDTLADNAGLIGLIGGGLLLLLIIVVVVVIIVRRRRGGGDVFEAPPPPSMSPLDDKTLIDVLSPVGDQEDSSDATMVMMPDFAISGAGGAYLEALEYAPEHTSMVPLIGSNIALGRDAKLVQVPFNDKSVSRLHARIMESNGTYRLYDEGSASGTYLNYERIGLTPRNLNDKDEIHLGRVHLRFHLAASPSMEDAPTMVSGSRQRGEDTDTQVYIPPE